MAKQLRQYRYYGESNVEENFPQNSAKIDFATGSIFFSDSNFTSIASLGIQTLPGVKFYLNDSIDAIIVGHSGIFELASTNKYEITALRFDMQSLELISSMSNSSCLIVDIIYNTKR